MCVSGSEASFIVSVKQLERYPVDLYYLVDVSASMQENLDHVGVHTFNCDSSFELSPPFSDSVQKCDTPFSKERVQGILKYHNFLTQIFTFL